MTLSETYAFKRHFVPSFFHIQSNLRHWPSGQACMHSAARQPPTPADALLEEADAHEGRGPCRPSSTPAHIVDGSTNAEKERPRKNGEPHEGGTRAAPRRVLAASLRRAERDSRR